MFLSNVTLRKGIRYMVALVSLVMVSCSSFSPTQPAPSSQQIPVQPTFAAPSGSLLYSVSILPTKEGWAVGGTFDSQGVGQSGFLFHYRNGRWPQTSIHVPLFSVSLISPRDGWAVGLSGEMFHYNGSQWIDMGSFTRTRSTLRSVFMISSRDGWAAGDDGIVLHYNGTTWAPTITQPENGATL